MRHSAALDQVINNQIRPQLLLHGGDIEVLSVEGGVLRFRLLGQCAGCPSADLTAQTLVREALVAALPEIKEAVLVQGVRDSLLQEARSLLRRKTP